MSGISLAELYGMWDRVKYAQVTSTTAGQNVFSSDVPETTTRYIMAIVASDTAGAANTLLAQRVKEDDSTEDVFPELNIASAGNIQVPDAGPVGMIPIAVLSGGQNMEFTAGSNNVEVTVIYIDSEE